MEKKILFVIDSLLGGGAQRVISLIADFFAKRNYKVSITTIYSGRRMYPLDENINHFCLYEKYTGYKISTLNDIKLLRKELKTGEYDTVISFISQVNIKVLIASRLLNIKTIVSERSDPKSNMTPGIRPVLRNILYKTADTIVFQTTEAKKYFPESVQKKSIVIPNPITDGLPEVKDLESKRIIAAGHLWPQKNMQMAIDAFNIFQKNHDDYYFDIYGKGRLKKNLVEHIKEQNLEDKISIKDGVRNIHEKMAQCGMYISSSAFEGISNSMLEALAIGLPAVVTDCPSGGAAATITSGENGVLVPVGDYRAMADAISLVADNPELAQKLSKNAMKIRDELNIEIIGESWYSLVD